MKLGIASDHRGFLLKEKLIKGLEEKGYEMINFGTNSKESTDYPDYAFLLGEAVRDNKVDFGIAICGSGIGISIACNKVKKVRCAKVVNEEEVIATRVDNNSNIIAFGENMPYEEALNLVLTFINTESSPLEKHQRRINKIMEYEER